MTDRKPRADGDRIPRLPRPRFAVAVVFLLAAAGAVHIAVPAAAQPLGGQYEAVAVADGLRTTVHAPGALLIETPADLGAPNSQASISSIDGSRSFAALPYPGDVVITLPATFGAVGMPRPPDYPLYAHAEHPAVPEQEQSGSGFALRATASRSAASATASAEDANDSRVTSRASTDVKRADNGDVIAVATAIMDALEVGPVQLSAVRSRVRVVAPAAGSRRTVEASLEVGEFTVGGTPVQVNLGALDAGDGSLVPIPMDEVQKALLSATGVELALVSSDVDDQGGSSAALQIRSAQPVPGTNNKVFLTYVVGATSAYERAVPGDGTAAPGDGMAVPGERRPESESTSTPSPDAVPATPTTVASPLPPTLDAPSDEGTSGPPSPVSPTRQRPAAVFALAAAGWFYALLVGAAGLAAGMLHMVREVGVRRPWVLHG